MNSAIEWANGLAGHWARGMWPVLWQTAALAAIVDLIVLCNRRMSPALRFWLWMLVPLRLLVMPLIVITLPVLANPPAAQPEPAVAPPPIVFQAPAEAPAPDLAAQPMSPAEPPSIPVQSHVRASIWTWLMAGWIAGIGFFSLRLARGWLRMKAIAGQARENSDARVRDCAREAAAMLGLRKIPRIMTAEEGVSPFVLGMVRPVVVLPAALAGHVSPEELRTVLAHEFAHVRRRDALVGWVLACSDVIYFFNPVAHFVRSRIMFERERACDEQILALAQAPRAVYARALLSATDLARPAAARLSCAPVLLESGQHLERRLKSIAEERRPCATLSRLARLCLLVAAVLALPGVTCTQRSATAPIVNASETETPPDYSPMLALELTGHEGELRAPTPKEIKMLGSLWPNVPLEQNTAWYFAEAAKTVGPNKDIPDGSSSGSKPYAGNVAAFEKWVEINQAAFKLMREGFEQKVCRPILLFSEKNGQPEPDGAFLARVRHLARTCADAGFLAELQKRPDAAAESYTDCLRLGMALRQHGVLIQELVGISASEIGQKNMDALIANSGLDEATLRTIIREFREAEVRSDEPATLWTTEVAYGEVLMALKEQKEPLSAIVNDQWRKQRGAMSQIIEKKTLPELLQQNVAKEIAEIEKKGPGAISDLSFPAMFRVFGELGRLDVRLRVTQIRAAIALYQKANGTLPDSLDALVPDILPSVPIDPFSGKPLRYARTQTGWKVWSVGENNVDHGGVSDATPEALRKEQVWQGPDYVFLSDIFSNLEVRSKIGAAQPTVPAQPLNSSVPAPTEKTQDNAGTMKECERNLSEIVKAVITYQQFNNDNLPLSLAELFPKYMDNPKVLICPADKAPMKLKNGMLCSYRYMGNPDWRDAGPGLIIAYDRTPHDGGRNVAFFDGHVSHLSEQDFQKALAKLCEELKPLMAKPDFPGDRDRVKAFCEDKDFPEQAATAAPPAKE